MFDAREYWQNRREGKRGQGEIKTSIVNLRLSKPPSIRKMKLAKWSDPKFTKKRVTRK